MGKLSKEEVAARRQQMQTEALKSVAKTEQLNIRIDQESIVRLYEIARKNGKPVGTMVREWILDRIEAEVSSGDPINKLSELVLGLQARIERFECLMLDEQVIVQGNDASKTMRERAEQDYLRLVS